MYCTGGITASHHSLLAAGTWGLHSHRAERHTLVLPWAPAEAGRSPQTCHSCRAALDCSVYQHTSLVKITIETEILLRWEHKNLLHDRSHLRSKDKHLALIATLPRARPQAAQQDLAIHCIVAAGLYLAVACPSIAVVGGALALALMASLVHLDCRLRTDCPVSCVLRMQCAGKVVY